jgi:hypothetical protein
LHQHPHLGRVVRYLVPLRAQGMGWESGHALEGVFFFEKPKKKKNANPDS